MKQALASLGMTVLVTLPHAWKMRDPRATPCWTISVTDAQGNRIGNTYRVTDLRKAHRVAEALARQAGLPITTREPPAIADSPAGIIDLDKKNPEGPLPANADAFDAPGF